MLGKFGLTRQLYLLGAGLIAVGAFAVAPVVNGARGVAPFVTLGMSLLLALIAVHALARRHARDEEGETAAEPAEEVDFHAAAQAAAAARHEAAALEQAARERAEAERAEAMENARAKRALDATTASLMLVDENNSIVYMNRAALQLMTRTQADWRSTAPGFDAARLLGTSLTVLGREAAQHGLLAAQERGITVDLKPGASTLRVSANPIFDAAGLRLGTVLEWSERTQELAMQAEVQTVIANVLKGDLTRRIVVDGKQGFLVSLSAGINELVDNVAQVASEVQSLVQAVNDGDLSRRIRTDGRSGLMTKLGEGINQLTGNVAEAVEHVQALVQAANDGDLGQRIDTQGRSGLVVTLAEGFNQLTGNMNRMVAEVKLAAEEVNRGAEEITTGNTVLSQRMEEQASSLEETASSMEEMTSTVRQNAENAGLANQLAVAARDQAEKGGAVVSRAMQAMHEINGASKRIADIIGVIDEIAFQTNLLALNAAVEAARAGEQGRGFAVVATEVRNLAGRSATAAKEIKALIQDSVDKVQDGSRLVTQSGATLEQIVASVKSVTDIVADIASASHEQSSGIEQVNRAVIQLDELTQQNAALVEQASASSLAMADQARGLNNLMHFFHVARETGVVADAEEPQQRSTGSAPGGVERRKSDRPWSGGGNSALARARRAGGAEAPDQGWKNF